MVDTIAKSHGVQEGTKPQLAIRVAPCYAPHSLRTGTHYALLLRTIGFITEV